jgi:hypothetical protein
MAVLHLHFMRNAGQMPTDTKKEEVKVCVEEHSCHAWRDGWSLVDGTLIPVSEQPFWFGESYFDNYSLNVQVSASIHNLRLYLMCHWAPRLYHYQISASSALVMVTLGAPTIRWCGRQLRWLKSMAPCLRQMSGFGLGRSQ